MNELLLLWVPYPGVSMYVFAGNSVFVVPVAKVKQTVARQCYTQMLNLIKTSVHMHPLFIK